jgi:predicted secreted protein
MRRDRTRPLRAVTLTVAAVTTLGGLVFAGPANAATAPKASDDSAPNSAPNRTVSMPDGSTITITPTGDARRSSAQGKLIAETMLPVSPGRDALGDSWAPSDAQVRARFTQLADTSRATDVIAVLSGSTAVTGAPVAGGMRAAVTSDNTVNAAFAKLDADAISPMFGQLPAAQVQQLNTDARSQLGTSAVDLSKVVVIHLHGGDPTAAANTLRATPGIAYAEPDQVISTESTGGTPLPAATTKLATQNNTDLPANYGLSSSLQSFLNAGGVDAEGAYSTIQQRFGQLPGTGELITNVSIGDLTDQSMADAGDGYVKTYGPTTVVQNGQRYLDLPSMPLIPTYTASPSGALDPTGSTEEQDPSLGEIMLDFGVMAPLPHNDQRTGATGSGATDLLGIAPGAQYRLVVPQQPTTDQLPVALLAAARQNPRPNVITASLGYGTDAQGFPGRYLEDDPIDQAVIAAIVQEYHIVVCISANDGTRLYTPTAVGPDGGSTPTNVTRDPGKTTDINDDADSTTPSQVLDSGAIAVGGTTLDDTLAVPTQNGGAQSHNGTWAATRTDGSGAFSSGFGSRVDVSAPSDGIPAFEHPQGGTPQDVETVLNGGTSASAPMTAAAAAVVLQTARLTGQAINPLQVRALLEHTGRAVQTPPQADQQLNVGPQVDLTAAVNSVLSTARGPQQRPQIARISVAHRQTLGELGGEFTEDTDPNLIDLQGPSGTGEGLVGPVTIAADVTGLPSNRPVDYVLTVGRQQFHSATPAIRLTPTELLTAAGQAVVATTNRTIGYTYAVRVDGRVVASAQRQLTFSPTDGGYAEAQAPVAPATVAAGKPVTVHYDLTGVRAVAKPELVVSTVGHPNPATGPIFTAAYTVALTGTTGSVTIPASAFDDGGGLYGIGIVQDSTGTPPFGHPVYGEFATIRVNGGTAAQRPEAPTFTAGHEAEVSRSAPGFALDYDTRNVPGATGAAVEFSAPSPTLYNSLNTFSNANGTARDHDGVDSGSVAYQQLGTASGTAQLDAVKLGLTGSLAYNVRVFATDHSGHIIGQASPTSQLIFDDGVTPNDGTVASFGAASTGPSVVAVRDPSGAESVREYQPKTGTYGTTLATDTSGSGGYDVLGVDATAQRALLLHWSTGGSFSLATYNTATGQLVADVPGASGEQATGGRVDTTRHRGAVLLRRTSDKADLVLPVDLTTGAVGTAIPADPAGTPAGEYSLIDIDQSTGAVLLSHVGGGLICFIGGASNVASIDLDAGTATAAKSADGCSDAIADDSGTGTLYQMSYRSFSVNIAGTTNLIPVSGNPLTAGIGIAVRQQPALTLAVDSVHHLALVAFQTPPSTPQFGNVLGAISDNNATSQLAVVDLTTGKTVSTVAGFVFGGGVFGGEYNPSTERAIQLDPTTRTGWTYAPGGDEVQQFSY